MILALGLILLLAPFILTFNFKDKKSGFLWVFVCVIIGQTLIGLTTQYFHVFSYLSTVIINVCVDLLVVSISVFLPKYSIKLSGIKPNWFVIFACLIVFLELYSVHFAYTGTVAHIDGNSNVLLQSFPYPSFSDEWSAIAIANYSIKTHALPTVNPLDGSIMMHPLIAFFSLISELFLLLGQTPLLAYQAFAFVGSLIIVVLIFVVAGDGKKFSKISGAVAALVAPLITTSGNLPGLWSLIPVTLGIMFFLVAFIAVKIKDLKLFLTSSFGALIIYPPMIIFLIPLGFAAGLISGHYSRKKIFQVGFASIILVALPATVIILVMSRSSGFLPTIELVRSYIFRNSLDGGVSSYVIWDIIPWYFLGLAAIGLWHSIVSRCWSIIVPLGVGFVFWSIYAFTTHLLIIDYPRVVYVTSIMLVILSGQGFDKLMEWLVKVALKPTWIKPIMVIFIFAMTISMLSYPSDAWSRLTFTMTQNGHQTFYMPDPPVTEYLTSQDLMLFANIKSAVFIAPPWKGLTIAAATGNFPLESKMSTISTLVYPYQQFMSLDCEQKSAVIKKYDVSYVYSYNQVIKCSNLSLVGISTENMYLYKII
ncbi:MAG: hypothetical protein KGJ35_02100 [Patescibacteria group bacterium]|nr:hypothetical protein [Patescibacteria group bacterium]